MENKNSGCPEKHSKKQNQNKLLLHFLCDTHDFGKLLFLFLVFSWLGWTVLICLDFPFLVPPPGSFCRCRLCSSLLEIRVAGGVVRASRGAWQRCWSLSRWYLWCRCLFRKHRALWICFALYYCLCNYRCSACSLVIKIIHGAVIFVEYSAVALVSSSSPVLEWVQPVVYFFFF